MCAHAHIHTHTCLGTYLKLEEAIRSPGAGDSVVTGVLGVELVSSIKAVYTLNHWALSSSLKAMHFELNFYWETCIW